MVRTPGCKGLGQAAFPSAPVSVIRSSELPDGLDRNREQEVLVACRDFASRVKGDCPGGRSLGSPVGLDNQRSAARFGIGAASQRRHESATRTPRPRGPRVVRRTGPEAEDDGPGDSAGGLTLLIMAGRGPRRVPAPRRARGRAGRPGRDIGHRAPRVPPVRCKWDLRTPGPHDLRAGRTESDGTPAGSGRSSRLFGGWWSGSRLCHGVWSVGTHGPAHDAAGGAHHACGSGSHEGHGCGRLAAGRRTELVSGRRPADSGSPVVRATSARSRRAGSDCRLQCVRVGWPPSVRTGWSRSSNGTSSM